MMFIFYDSVSSFLSMPYLMLYWFGTWIIDMSLIGLREFLIVIVVFHWCFSECVRKCERTLFHLEPTLLRIHSSRGLKIFVNYQHIHWGLLQFLYNIEGLCPESCHLYIVPRKLPLFWNFDHVLSMHQCTDILEWFM